MSIRDLKDKLEGQVLRTSVRTLTEKEMATIVGGGPVIISDGEGGCVTCCCINGCSEPDDCGY
jgi:bacteriocin-like protein